MTRNEFLKRGFIGFFAGFFAKKAVATPEVEELPTNWVCGMKTGEYEYTWTASDDFFPFLFLKREDLVQGYKVMGVDRCVYAWDAEREIFWAEEKLAEMVKAPTMSFTYLASPFQITPPFHPTCNIV